MLNQPPQPGTCLKADKSALMVTQAKDHAGHRPQRQQRDRVTDKTAVGQAIPIA